MSRGGLASGRQLQRLDSGGAWWARRVGRHGALVLGMIGSTGAVVRPGSKRRSLARGWHPGGLVAVLHFTPPPEESPWFAVAGG